jgi:excisionase family DNA binding protein
MDRAEAAVRRLAQCAELEVTAATGNQRPFYSVAEVAELLGMSDMTIYRAIRNGEFPAVRIRGRLIVPARVIDAMADAAVDGDGVVDAADWVAPDPPPGRSRHVVGRPRPGANQTGAGSFSTQHAAGYGEDPTPGRRGRRRGGVA